MSAGRELLSADELRREFDGRFALPHPEPDEDREPILVARARDLRLGLRSAELSTLAGLPPLGALPSLHPAVVGLTAVRASVVVVHDLASLVERNGAEPAGLRWIVVPRRDPTIGFAFAELEGLFDVPRAAVDESRGGSDGPVAGSVVLGGATCALIDFDELLASIERFAVAGTAARGDDT